jgi:hypothetical protein
MVEMAGEQLTAVIALPIELCDVRSQQDLNLHLPYEVTALYTTGQTS